MSSVAAPSRRLTIHLSEDVVRSYGGSLRVDRDKGIIYGVKVLGLESANGRRYTREAAKRAIRLYERASVRTNHPKKVTDQRNIEEVFGWLENVRVAKSGCLYGDLHILNPKTELAESVLLAAEKNPRLFGLSHNATGRGKKVQGVLEIDEIVEVHSVDLVADPATTHGLFEGKTMLKPTKKAPVVTTEDEEMGYEEPVTPEEPAAEEPVGDPLLAGFEAKTLEIFRNTEMDAQGKLGMFRELLKAQERLAAMGQASVAEEEDEEEDEEAADESRHRGKPAAGTRALQEELRRFRQQEKALALCEAQGVTPNKVLRLALASAKDEKEMLALIKEHRATSRTASRVRSQSSHQLAESRQAVKPAADGKAFAAAILRRR